MTDQNRLTEWNQLADKLRELYGRYSSLPRMLTTMEVVGDISFAVIQRMDDMVLALADPLTDRPDEAGEQVQGLREQIERFNAALDRDQTLRGRRHSFCIEYDPPDHRLPDTVVEVRRKASELLS